MSDHPIEILGQKISYPDSWQGVISVVAVCACIVSVAFIFDPKRIAAVGDAIANAKKEGVSAISKNSAKAEATIDVQAKEIIELRKAVVKLNSNTNLDPKVESSIIKPLIEKRNNTNKFISEYIQSSNDLSVKFDELEKEFPSIKNDPVFTQYKYESVPNLDIRLEELEKSGENNYSE